MRTHDEEISALLLIIRELRDALSTADPQSSEIHRQKIQRATTILDYYGADEPTFSS